MNKKNRCAHKKIVQSPPSLAALCVHAAYTAYLNLHHFHRIRYPRLLSVLVFVVGTAYIHAVYDLAPDFIDFRMEGGGGSAI